LKWIISAPLMKHRTRAVISGFRSMGYVSKARKEAGGVVGTRWMVPQCRMRAYSTRKRNANCELGQSGLLLLCLHPHDCGDLPKVDVPSLTPPMPMPGSDARDRQWPDALVG